MKGLRKIVPHISLGLFLGLVAFLLGSTVLASPPDPESAVHAPFTIKSKTTEEPALFTRHFMDGEVENTDNREKVEVIGWTGIILQSRMLSDFVPIIQNRLAGLSRTGPPITILLGQLII